MDLAGTKVTVVGLARSGVAAAKLLQQAGARVTVADRKERGELTSVLERLDESKINVTVGSGYESALEVADLVVISPGVPYRMEALERVRRRGVKVISEVIGEFRPMQTMLPPTGPARQRRLPRQRLQRRGRRRRRLGHRPGHLVRRRGRRRLRGRLHLRHGVFPAFLLRHRQHRLRRRQRHGEPGGHRDLQRRRRRLQRPGRRRPRQLHLRHRRLPAHRRQLRRR